jgi:hypothetical protein
MGCSARSTPTAAATTSRRRRLADGCRGLRLMRTRPIYHSSDAAIRGHVFCSFHAFVLRKELDERCQIAGLRPERTDVLRELDRLQEIELNKDGWQIIMRTPAIGIISPLFKVARVTLPANIRKPASI